MENISEEINNLLVIDGENEYNNLLISVGEQSFKKLMNEDLNEE